LPLLDIAAFRPPRGYNLKPKGARQLPGLFFEPIENRLSGFFKTAFDSRSWRPGSKTMQIWVDADACPSVIREIIAKAAHNRMITTTFVANHTFSLPNSQFVTFYQVPSGFDEADKEIERRVSHGDLVITADIPLASDVLQRGALVLTPRGERYTDNNIKQRLQMRDFMETMRSSGAQTGGPPALSLSDRKHFSDQLDRLLTRAQKEA
jgi:uncharacterized protein YaiI (UPF0178 family)